MAKRIYRNDMAQDQKDKIAAANRGKHLTTATKAKISRAMAEYWASLPYKPDEEDGTGRPTALYTPADKQIQAATGQEPTKLPHPPRRPAGTTKQPTKPGHGGNTGRPGKPGNTGNTGITYY